MGSLTATAWHYFGVEKGLTNNGVMDSNEIYGRTNIVHMSRWVNKVHVAVLVPSCLLLY